MPIAYVATTAINTCMRIFLGFIFCEASSMLYSSISFYARIYVAKRRIDPPLATFFVRLNDDIYFGGRRRKFAESSNFAESVFNLH